MATAVYIYTGHRHLQVPSQLYVWSHPTTPPPWVMAGQYRMAQTLPYTLPCNPPYNLPYTLRTLCTSVQFGQKYRTGPYAHLQPSNRFNTDRPTPTDSHNLPYRLDPTNTCNHSYRLDRFSTYWPKHTEQTRTAYLPYTVVRRCTSVHSDQYVQV